MSRSIDRSGQKPRERINEFRRNPPSRRVAARVMALYLWAIKSLPAKMKVVDRWDTNGVEMVKVDVGVSHEPDSFFYRPIDGMIPWHSVIFQAASISRVFGFDSLAVEKWLWTGDPEIPASWGPKECADD